MVKSIKYSVKKPIMTFLLNISLILLLKKSLKRAVSFQNLSVEEEGGG